MATAPMSLTTSGGFGMVPPPGIVTAPPIQTLGVGTGLTPPTSGIPPVGVLSTPQLATAVPPVGVLGVPQPSVLAQVSAVSTTGVSTPPMMMLVNGAPGMLDGVYQADQTGPVFSGPGATKEKSIFKLCKTSSSQSDQINRAKKYAMEQSIKTVLVKQTIAHQAQQQLNFQTNVQKQQALALMCRIYVGSINFEIKEDTIKQAFQPFGPIKSVNLSWDSVTNKHKGFAFIEYDIPEAASLAMEQMNGVMIGGRNIKVGRPTNMPQAQPIIEQLKEEAKGYNRIYVSSIHHDLETNDVKSVFEAFGQIRTCQLVPEPTKPGKHKGYGFIEYTTSQSAEDAVSSMNLFDLGGMFLRVGKAITPPDVFIAPTMVTGQPSISSLPTASAIAAAAVTAKLTALEAQQPLQELEAPPVSVATSLSLATTSAVTPQSGLATTLPPIGVATPSLASTTSAAVPAVATAAASTAVTSMSSSSPVSISQTTPSAVSEPPPPTKEDNTIQAQENLKISGRDARHMVMQKLMRQSDECKVCVLRNMVGPDDLDEDLQTEVEEECSRYGQVERVIIYSEKQGEEEDAEVIVKIFVEFTKESEVELAVSSLNGRYFGGRVVRAEKYSQDLYQAQDFSG